MSEYSTPVQHLFTLGQPKNREWLDYRAAGLRAEHVPELVRLALDSSLFGRYPADEAPGWAPIES